MTVETEDFIVPITGSLTVDQLDLTLYKSDVPLDPTEYEFLMYGAEEYVKTGSSFYLTDENQIKQGSEPITGRSFPVWYFKSKKKYFIVRSADPTPEWVWIDLPYVAFYELRGGRHEGTYIEFQNKQFDRYYLDILTNKIFSNDTEDKSVVEEPIWNQDFPETYTNVLRKNFAGPIYVDQGNTQMILPAKGNNGIMSWVTISVNFMKNNSVTVDNSEYDQWEYEHFVPPNFTSNFEGLIKAEDVINGQLDITQTMNNYLEINSGSYPGKYYLSKKQNLGEIAYFLQNLDGKIFPTLKKTYRAKNLTSGEYLIKSAKPYHIDSSFTFREDSEMNNKINYFAWRDSNSLYIYDVSEGGWIRFEDFPTYYDGLYSPVSRANADARSLRQGVDYYITHNNVNYFLLETLNYTISNEPNQTAKISLSSGSRAAWNSPDGSKTLIYDTSNYSDTVTFSSTSLAGDYRIYGSNNYRLEKISFSTKKLLNRAGSYPLWRKTDNSFFMIWDDEASNWKKVSISSSQIYDNNKISAFDIDLFTGTTNGTSNGKNYPKKRGGTISKYAVAKTPSWIILNADINVVSNLSVTSTSTRLNSTSNSLYPTNLSITTSSKFEILGSDTSKLQGPNYVNEYGFDEENMLNSAENDILESTSGETMFWRDYLPQIYEHESDGHLIMAMHSEVRGGSESIGWVVVPENDIKNNAFSLLSSATFNDTEEIWNLESLPTKSNKIAYRTLSKLPISYGGFTENPAPFYEIPDGIPSQTNVDTFVDEVLSIGPVGNSEHYPIANNVFFDGLANTYYIHVDDLMMQSEISMIVTKFKEVHPNSPYVIVPRGLQLPTYEVQMGRH